MGLPPEQKRSLTLFKRNKSAFPKVSLCAVCLLLCLLLPPWPAGAAERQGKLLARKDGQYKVWQEGFFRVRFTREGDAAVPAADENHNGCPDFVEDVAAQLVAAHLLFCEAGGFASPRASSRYAGVRYIDVEIRSGKAMGGHSGLAYDEISLRPELRGAFAPVPLNALPRVPVLLIALSRDIDPKKNISPAHEYFHQIQNGMTRFKMPWFYEGMARWSESALRPARRSARPPSRRSLPDLSDPAYQKMLFAASYKASDMLWNTLADLCPGASPALPDTHPVWALSYSDGSPVLRKGLRPGLPIMKRVLEKLAETEHIPFSRLNYEKWTEANQRNAANNPFVLDAVFGALRELCPERAATSVSLESCGSNSH